MKRRDFLKFSATGFLHARGRTETRREETTFPILSQVKGGSAKEITRRAVESLGGMGRFVSRGESVLVHPNIGWDRLPEQAANTNPEVVTEVVSMCIRAGASRVVVLDNTTHEAELCYERSGIGPAVKAAGAQVVVLHKQDFVKRVLEITEGYGAKLYLEASGIPQIVFPEIERAIWEGRCLNSKVVIVARADAKIPVTGEIFQVRRASIVGSQGHSGHGTFPRVITAMASGMDMTPLITKKITLSQLPENLVSLRSAKEECKITVTNFD